MSTLASLTHILPLTRIRRERVLPRRGKVLVQQGQRVSPSDIIAEANLAPEYVTLNIARSLRLPVAKADQSLERQEGDEVSLDDIIATGPKGFIRRIVRAPCNGRIVLAGDGQVLIEKDSYLQPLYAGYSGVVIDLIPERGGIIETIGALVQGVWGNTRIGSGVSYGGETHPPGLPLTVDMLKDDMRDTIVLFGNCSQVEALRAAQNIKVGGLMLGSMSSTLIPAAMEVPYPIILTEGFGRLPINTAAYKLLTTSANREISLCAEPFDRYTGTRPEIVIPLPATDRPPLPTLYQLFKPGQLVRLVGGSNRSEVGRIINLAGLQRLSSGIRAQAAEVQLDGDKKVITPLANLDLLE